ncbi:MAG: DUF4394 domain-containing protein, partial [Bacteroidetes bacterium]|nr:DUF4394 domain-containing protein [Bacteroidota bacterium]
ETFDVTMTITPGGYSSTKQVVNLNPFTPIQVTFDPWNATVGNYTITVCTQLVGDMDPLNDCIYNQPISVQELRKVYAYVAYDPTLLLPEGPAWFYVQTPGTITSLAATTSAQFISAGTWADGVWYGSEYYDGATGGGWWTIDPITGAMTLIGYNTPPIGFAGITYDKVSGIMYGTNWNGTSDELYTINPATGAATLLGTYSTQLMINLAADGSGFLYGIGIIDDQLYKITPTTPPVAVAVGPTGQAFNYAQDMEFDYDNNIMYACGYTTTGTLYTVDIATGACTAIGNFQGGSEMTGFAIPYTSIAQITGTIQTDGGITPPESDVYIQAHRHCNPSDVISTTSGGITYSVVGGVGTYTVDRNSFATPPSVGSVVVISVWNTVTGAFSTIEVVITPDPIIVVNIIIRITVPVFLPTWTSFIVVVIPAHKTLKIHYTATNGCSNTDVYVWDGTRWVKYRQWNYNYYCQWRYIRNDSDQPMVFIIHNDSYNPNGIHFDLVFDVVVYPTTPSNGDVYAVLDLGWMDRPNPSCEFGTIVSPSHYFVYQEAPYLDQVPSRLGPDGVQNFTVEFAHNGNSWWGDMALMLDLIDVTQAGTLALSIDGNPVSSATINPGDVTVNLPAGGILTPGTHTMMLSATGGLSMGMDAFLFTTIIPNFRVYGNVYYGPTGTTKPMATNTTVTLTPATPLGTVPTHSPAGDYEFICVMNGNYTLTGATTKPFGGLQALDAIQVQRFVAGAVTFTNLQKRAADVNKSSSVQNLDAIQVQRFVAGAVTFTNLQKRAADVNKSSSVQNLDATFIRRRVSSIPVPQWTAPNWIFDGPFGTPPALQELPVTVAGSDLNQVLRTLCSGDVNGSYNPPAE